MVGLVILGIISLVPLLATTVGSSVTLAHSVQTTYFVSHLVNNIPYFLETQEDIDLNLEVQINAFKATVLDIGDPVKILQNYEGL